MDPAPPPAADEHDDPVPILGSWRAIYAAVIAFAVLWIALSWIFSAWAF